MYKKSSKRKEINSKIQRNSPPPPSSSPISTPQIPQSMQQSSPSMFDSIKQGFGFGIGSSIANKAVNSIFNSNDKKDIKADKDYNLIENKIYDLYNKCLENNNNDIDCNHILEKK